jgi:hypothetical protein
MAIYAVVDSSGLIVNRVELDDPESWSPPEGCTIVLETDVPLAIGGTYIDGVYTSPPDLGAPPDLRPTPDANARLTQGVAGAVDTWNETPSVSPSDDDLVARVTRLEETVQAMCKGQMVQVGPAPVFR